MRKQRKRIGGGDVAKRDLTMAERRQAGFGCGLLFGLMLLAVLGSIGDDMCRTATFGRSTAPGGWWRARVQMTDCGALNGFSRVVRVQPSWLPEDRWLSCRAAALDGAHAVSLIWTRNTLHVVTDAQQSDVIDVARTCQGWRVQLHLRSGGP
ncbi:hypothetical protein SAMN05192583_1235 [Sphingomonas gellani]|uniref:Uncharacterized protein n=1 Tax=Sphingomonas gellani TaxID=1166340 RepID=A0A1H8BA76_9SPHN|nr:hypothetical protein [Sphingomonas gellani]SEM78767.1 hypothetical protein SAMN05192583_1235 [Sphingomonas gellani]